MAQESGVAKGPHIWYDLIMFKFSIPIIHALWSIILSHTMHYLGACLICWNEGIFLCVANSCWPRGSQNTGVSLSREASCGSLKGLGRCIHVYTKNLTRTGSLTWLIVRMVLKATKSSLLPAHRLQTYNINALSFLNHGNCHFQMGIYQKVIPSAVYCVCDHLAGRRWSMVTVVVHS